MTGGWGTPRVLGIKLDPNGLGWIEVGPEPAAAEATIEQDELSPDERITEPPEAPGPQTGAERVHDAHCEADWGPQGQENPCRCGRVADA